MTPRFESLVVNRLIVLRKARHASFYFSGLKSCKLLLSYKRNENSNRANRKVDGRLEAEIIKLACGPVPEGYARWSIRLLAREIFVLLGDEAVSADTIRRTLKKTGFVLTKAATGASHKDPMQNS